MSDRNRLSPPKIMKAASSLKGREFFYHLLREAEGDAALVHRAIKTCSTVKYGSVIENNVWPIRHVDPVAAMKFVKEMKNKKCGCGPVYTKNMEFDPYVRWKHVDATKVGPALVCSSGQIFWLSRWDRFLLFFRLTNNKKLEKKYTAKV